MGTWGPGVFENDGALGARVEVFKKTISELEGFLAPGVCVEDLGSALGYVAIATALLKTVGTSPPPSADAITAWKRTCLGVFDGEIDGLGASEDFKKERRRVIASEFTKFERAAAKLR